MFMSIAKLSSWESNPDLAGPAANSEMQEMDGQTCIPEYFPECVPEYIPECVPEHVPEYVSSHFAGK